jgi:4-diphosphocytidyl-2C-methyl-D-erythritol kinase
MANALYPKWKEQLMQGTAAALLTGSGTTFFHSKAYIAYGPLFISFY